MEYVLRFAFGGFVTALTGLIAHAYGPSIGGLFLAFPAILPASLTLVAAHEGRRHAADDARGAVLGAVGLGAFALLARALALRCGTAATLASATGAWLAVALGLWVLRYGDRRSRTSPGGDGHDSPGPGSVPHPRDRTGCDQEVPWRDTERRPRAK